MPFHLDRVVDQWRNELSAGGLPSHQIRELESHLTASCAELEGRGLAPEEAFWLARRRLGSTAELAAEFAKLDPARPSRERLGWFTAGLLASYAAPTALSLASTLMQRQLREWGLPPTGVWWWSVEAAGFAVIVGVLLFAATRTARGRWGLPAFQQRSRRAAAGAFALVAFASILCCGMAWTDSRLVSATPADGFGAMLFAGCAIERTSASMLHAIFIVLWTAAALWVSRRRNASLAHAG